MDTGAPFAPALKLEAFLAEVRAGAWPGLLRNGVLPPDAAVFLKGYLEDLTSEEVRGLSLRDIVALADPFWAFGEDRAPGVRKVRLRDATGPDGRPLERTVLEIVGDDRPFLVSSVMGEVSDQELSAAALVHPIVRVCRDDKGVRGPGDPHLPESYIQVQFGPLSPARREALLAGVRETLEDVEAAVRDYAALRARMTSAAVELSAAHSSVPPEELRETVEFLRWLENANFVFLGARDYQFAREGNGEFARDEPIVLEETGLGVLRDPNRFVLRRAAEPSVLTPEIARFLQEPAPIVVAKSNLRSRVHRRAVADYVGVKRYGPKGEVIGETRFVGLFTADAYNEPTREIPLLRRKVERVNSRVAALPGSHKSKVLRNVLETLPRDELFQATEAELTQLALGVLHLIDRPRPSVLLRRDRFNRFLSAMAYVPKERFNSTVRELIGRRLEEVFGGRITAFTPYLGDGPLARIHFIISDIDRSRPDPDPMVLDAELAQLTRTWEDRFEDVLRASADDPYRLSAIRRRYLSAFGAAYKERFAPEEALIDIAEFDRLSADQSVRVRAFRLRGDSAKILRCKIYSLGQQLPLSAVMPILENMGLFVQTEDSIQVRREAGEGEEALWLHDLEMRAASGRDIDLETVDRCFEAAFEAIWKGRAENDGFNRLIIEMGVSWRKAGLIRALARYRQQTGLDPSTSVVEQALAEHPAVVHDIIALFRARFDPAAFSEHAARTAEVERLRVAVEGNLDAVQSLDADRVLRRLARLVLAIQRTNYFQTGPDGELKRYYSFKIASPELEDLPEPKPFREIWVWGPEVEGVHLRFGPVARGGLRWSDRRDDFRTEVLDLVKAQQVKNAIIVPVGAKGGFYPKQLPKGAPFPQVRAAAIEAYKIFLRGLLDITDTLADGRVAPPKEVVRWDGDDPYLVVAADKGTATFSDIANGVSAEYGFWLGDAFASGGSAGYDHKGMGITARGAWEAVKRHFRESGKNIQEQPFDVVGVGDMSGDVFGNGMLLSRKIRLLAAFDHRDIFLDPAPADLETAWAERKRLFDKPGSSWQDYDRNLISAGGGVFSRAEKRIQVSAQVRAMLDIEQTVLSAAELLSAILKARCDLLWFGGIGTYIKAARESHAEVGDKANDPIRVNAEQLRCQVIGEGANLGVTQAGRIAFARRGGRINTDAVDNSAGVDTSDHEVNIKILLGDAIRSGALAAGDRDALLAAMTDAVGEHVLSHNYFQTLGLSLTQADAAGDLDAHERFMARLERAGRLSRRVEGLPDTDEMRELRQRGAGLTRPELSKLVAYAKIDIFNALVDSAAPDDPYFLETLQGYFPPQLTAFEQPMQGHRLRREIIATVLADDVVNWGGPVFVQRIQDMARAETAEIVLAFEAARRIYQLRAFADRINALDNQVPAEAQHALWREVRALLSRVTARLVLEQPARARGGVAALIEAYADPVGEQLQAGLALFTPYERAAAEAKLETLRQAGAPEPLAAHAALFGGMVQALGVADLAAETGSPPRAAAVLFRGAGAVLGLDRARDAAAALQLPAHYDRLALRRTLEELDGVQRALAARAARTAPPQEDPAIAQERLTAWLSSLGERAAEAMRIVAEFEASGPWSLAKSTLIAAELRALAEA
jgi:glutamate dehydrogenase